MEKLFTGTWVLPSFITLTILVCASVIFHLSLKKKEKALALALHRLKEKERIVELLEDELRREKIEIERQSGQIKSMEEMVRRMKERDISLFRSQFSDISRLLQNRSFSLRQNHSEEVLAQKVDLILERIIGGSDGLGELVNCINKHFDNVLVRLNDDLPDMPKVDFKLLCYYCIGLPPEEIYPLLGLNNVSTLYIRKKRLSDKIKTLRSAHRDLYLALLNPGRV